MDNEHRKRMLEGIQELLIQVKCLADKVSPEPKKPEPNDPDLSDDTLDRLLNQLHEAQTTDYPSRLNVFIGHNFQATEEECNEFRIKYLDYKDILIPTPNETIVNAYHEMSTTDDACRFCCLLSQHIYNSITAEHGVHVYLPSNIEPALLDFSCRAAQDDLTLQNSKFMFFYAFDEVTKEYRPATQVVRLSKEANNHIVFKLGKAHDLI